MLSQHTQNRDIEEDKATLVAYRERLDGHAGRGVVE